MDDPTDERLQKIRQKSRQKVATLSRQFARAKSEEKGEILDAMEFERELADMCDECLDQA